jgi:tetratricopeptide (TPR) repeat protein
MWTGLEFGIQYNKLNIMTFLLVFATVFTLTAQKNKSNQTKETVIEKKVLEQALKYADVTTAVNSIHKIIAHEGEKSTYKDTLAMVYFKAQNYVSSHLVAKELLASKADNQQLLEINAVSLQNLGATKEAIDAYEKLFALSKNRYHGYELANLQMSIKRLEEAKLSIEKAFTCAEIEKATLVFPIDNTKNQDVPLNAAMYNLKGIIYYQLQDKVEAGKAFEEALKIMPEFATATQNNNVLAIVTK